MNSEELFRILVDLTPVEAGEDFEVTDEAYEYLIKFCEINRNRLIKRIKGEGVEISSPILFYRICLLLEKGWLGRGDYRSLNLLYKFRANGYFGGLGMDAKSIAFKIQLEETLARELSDA